MEIITGRTGTPHVYAADDAEIYKLFLGNADLVLPTGNKLEARMHGTNEVRVYDGSIMMQGRLAKIRPSDGFDVLSLDIGETGMKRMDLIVAEYNQTTEIRQEEVEGELVTITNITESVQLKVIKGTPNANQYIEPTITTGDIDLGQTHQMKLWGVRLDSINFDSLVDYRSQAMLDTTPIQAAISIAQSSIATIRNQMAELQTDIYQYADDLYASISQGIKGQWKKSVTVSNATSAIAVDMGSSYTYLATDVVDVYLNGLRLGTSEYSVTGANSTINVTLTANTFTGQMEVVATKIAEEA